MNLIGVSGYLDRFSIGFLYFSQPRALEHWKMSLFALCLQAF
jgi:hypothetical protein